MTPQTPTPETDALLEIVRSGKGPPLIWDKMRDLEIERNDAQSQITELTDRWEKAANAYLIEKGVSEAARAEADGLAEKLGNLLDYADSCGPGEPGCPTSSIEIAREALAARKQPQG